MYLFSSILLAFSASLDSFIIGIAYGIKKIKIKLRINIIIALIVTFGTFLSMLLGSILGKFIPAYICNYVGAILLIFVGLWMALNYLKEQKISNNSCPTNDNAIINDFIDSLNYDEILTKNKTADIDGSGNIEIKESISLALALSINNFALGIAASMSGISISLTTVFTFIFSVLILILGLKIGNSFLSKLFGKYSNLISSIIIILMGVFQLFFNHL